MKIALMDSGIGLLPAAAALRALRPDADLVVSQDPDGMPWGPRTPEDITAHALAVARAAAEQKPDALVVACNTASVHALEAIRAELEPDIPVIGTVPAIKPAAASGGSVAIWATPATTGSAYQRGLIRDFAGGAEVTEIPCPGLADAVEYARPDEIATSVAAAAALTPEGTRALVLGCTHYELVAAEIRAALADACPDLVFFGSARAVAEQALRRARPLRERGEGSLTVLRSGREEALPAAALAYPEGRGLLGLSG
ncbi:glutamate racemase [Streptacidiphilus rugosus]|uniref:glutamate racemase n=1 Tax=Streptacidiphilus rugosus TaxID=405783 RepID=UPI000559D4F8|nr:aspartate/glutamate racemase family protein [Streptacidiphilus rugosus]